MWKRKKKGSEDTGRSNETLLLELFELLFAIKRRWAHEEKKVERGNEIKNSQLNYNSNERRSTMICFTCEKPVCATRRYRGQTDYERICKSLGA